jgi:hypothetical protein
MHVRRLFSGLNPRIVQASADTPTEVRPSQAATSGPGLAGGASAASLPKSGDEWKASRPAASINVPIAAQQHRLCSSSPLISAPFAMLEADPAAPSRTGRLARSGPGNRGGRSGRGSEHALNHPADWLAEPSWSVLRS